MKKIYMIMSAALISGGVFGQISKPQAVKNSDSRISTNVEVTPNTDRAIIWTNTFSDPNDWATGDSGPVGLNFEVGTGLTTGGGAPIAEINSASYADGVAMVDSDEWANQTAIENCWIQNVTPIDLTENPYVMIEFANQYRMWDGGASDGNEYCILEISTDGTTWPDVETYEVADAAPGTRFEVWPLMETQDFVANPTMVRFNISEVAGGEPTVYLRFRWVGTYGYAWFIDDIEVYDGFENDISVEGTAFANGSSYTNINGTRFVPIEEIDGEIFTGLEYTKYPESQRPEIMAYSSLINWGASDMNEVVLSGTFNGTSNSAAPVAIPAGEAIDSLAVLQWPTAGLATGPYDFTLDVAGEVMDDDMTNNQAIAGLEMTDFIYARDDELIRGQFPGQNNQGESFSAGCLYEIFGDATIYAIDVAVMNSTVEGEEVLVQLIDGTADDFGAGILVESESVELTNTGLFNDFDGGDISWITIELEEPFNVANGDLLLPVITYFSGDGVQIGEAQSDAQDQTAFIFGAFGAGGDTDWFFSNDLPMVRLNFSEDAQTNATGVEELASANFSLGQNIPNPSNGVTAINYALTQNGNVSFEILDITGKQVFTSYVGQRGTGNYTIEFDTAELNAGVYSYVLTVDGDRLSKRMIVK